MEHVRRQKNWVKIWTIVSAIAITLGCGPLIVGWLGAGIAVAQLPPRVDTLEAKSATNEIRQASMEQWMRDTREVQNHIVVQLDDIQNALHVQIRTNRFIR